jgi:hypothetical protein
MGTSKEVVMMCIASALFAVWIALLSSASLAQSETEDELQHISSVVYRFVAANHLADETFTEEPLLAFGAEQDQPLRLKTYRARDLGLSKTASNMLLGNDWGVFKVETPMPAMNNALSLAGTILQTPLNDNATKLIQALSFAATRQVKVELNYAAQFSKYSRLNSTITYRRNLANDADHDADDQTLSVRIGFSF